MIGSALATEGVHGADPRFDPGLALPGRTAEHNTRGPERQLLQLKGWHVERRDHIEIGRRRETGTAPQWHGR
jgi:hypothetical protein